MKLILLRHGESQWNLKNKFTGWTDVDLTENGKIEANFAADQIKKNKISIDSVHTSILSRAMQTAHIIVNNIDFLKEDIVYDWRLNERHYGALQGLNKKDTAKKYGEDKVFMWRRSYDYPPPLITNNQEQSNVFVNEKLKQIENPPLGESLKDVIKRLKPFWIKYFNKISLIRGNHLIVAHSNSLRAIIKIIEKMSPEEILSVNIPTGIPKVYDFNSKNEIISSKYLIDDKLLNEKQNEVIAQSKISIQE